MGNGRILQRDFLPEAENKFEAALWGSKLKLGKSQWCFRSCGNRQL
jgi:hypothetical protein